MQWLSFLRFVHVAAVACWLGEVVTINVVIVPAVLRMTRPAQLELLPQVFPRIFKLASILSATAVASGLTLLLSLYGAHLTVLVQTPRGVALIAGLTLGTALTTVHFVLEPKLDGMICHAAAREDLVVTERVLFLLRIVPRAGLVVLGSTFLLMLYAAHGC